MPSASGKLSEDSKIQLTHGIPDRNLPNLDNARRMTSAIPKTISQVPINKHTASTNQVAIDLITNLLLPSRAEYGGISAISSLFGLNEDNWKKEQNQNSPSLSKSIQPVASMSMLQEDNSAVALFDPKNRVGTGGEDLLSRNYNWGIPLVSLPGRAGMNLDLGLSLNSLVWTKSGGNIHFNLDNGFPSPGFHLGLPELGTGFYNNETEIRAIVVTMPSGGRLEFRENKVLGNNIYEEQTGTNMLLVIQPGQYDYKDTIWKLLLPDGATYKFKIIKNNPQCIEVKDRNGNYISINYTDFERINTITDTLGRVINFNYDANKLLTSITQSWSGRTHTWATFAYENGFVARIL